jgi:hypothetical protein
MINFFATQHGAAKNRAGSKYIASTKADAAVRFIPFVFSSTQTYVLEFGNLYVRFYQNGGQVQLAGAAYEVVTPYAAADVPRLKFAQSGDIITLVHPNYAPRELRRLGHTNWVLSTIAFTAPTAAVFSAAPSIASPAPQPDTSHPAREWVWLLTQVLKDSTGRVFETLPTVLNPPLYNGATTYAQGDVVLRVGTSWTSLVAANIGNAPETPGSTQWVKGVVQYPDKPINIAWATVAVPVGYSLLLTNIYRSLSNNITQGAGNFVAGLVGSVAAPAIGFTDGTGTPDLGNPPPKGTDPTAAATDGNGTAVTGVQYPATVALFEQRRVFGNQPLAAHRIRGSKPADIYNFDTSFLVQDDDAISFDLASNQLDEIRSLVSLRQLIALSQSGEYQIEGFQGSPLSPSSIDVRRHSSRGSSWLDPLVIGNTILHVQDKGNTVRDLVYDYRTDSYNGTFLSTLASHLFEGRTIVDAAYQGVPDSIAWFVRDDGCSSG